MKITKHTKGAILQSETHVITITIRDTVTATITFAARVTVTVTQKSQTQ